jgi:long-chain fatty acid transport protein
MTNIEYRTTNNEKRKTTNNERKMFCKGRPSREDKSAEKIAFLYFFVSCAIINQKIHIMKKVSLLLLCLFITAMNSFAGGYQVGLHSQRNIGMGLIGTSLTYDASALFYNPGGASFINSKFSFSGGLSFLMARTTFQAKDQAYQEEIKHELNYPFYFYAAYKPIKDLSVGIAVNTPYGLSMSWPDDWKGRFVIQNISFKAITIQPTISYKIKDIIGIGAGLIISYGNVSLNKALPLESASGEGKTNIKGSTIKYGYNIGVMVHPLKGLNIGIDYRSKIDMKVTDGDVTFTVPASVASNFTANKVDVTLPLPANLDFGASYEINEKWMVGFSLNYVFWNVYDSLVFNFKPATAALGKVSTAKLYDNKLIARIGAQYKVNSLLTIRAGGYYDPSPVKDDYVDPMLPSANEIGLTCGVSIFPVKGFSIDAAFLYLMGSKRDGNDLNDNFAGTYKTAIFAPGIGLSYNF